ncbi:MAG: nucleoside recognition domain-containing protein [Bdellovibrionota bacterium]|jgi:spore maturation protein SpmA
MKKKSSAINIIFVSFIIISILLGAYNGNLQAVVDASFATAKSAVSLAIGLIGIMALWLGLVRILEAGGLMYSLAEAVRPYLQKLFPDIPAGHPAMSAMLLNISANMLGLGNAATPFGLKAMTELDKINPIKGTATNAMCLFLAINTSSVTLLPLGVIGVRAAAGCGRPADIFLPTLIATSISTLVAVLAAIFFAARDKQYTAAVIAAPSENADVTLPQEDCEKDDRHNKYDNLLTTPTKTGRFLCWLTLGTIATIFVYRLVSIFIKTSDAVLLQSSPICALGISCTTWNAVKDFLMNEVISFWLMPLLMLLIISYGFYRGVKMYEAVTDGAKQGFDIAVRIIPFLVAILVAVGMFRASGAMAILTDMIGPYTAWIGLPAEALPVALLRPLSGTGAFAVVSEIINHAPNSYEAFVASILMGCTETTFYVIAVYFGSVGITRIRHALACGLLADIAGIIASSLVASLFWIPS